MKEKIRNVVLGCWFVLISEIHLFLVRVGLRSPDLDPFENFPLEEY